MSKKAIDLMLININKIVVSDKFELNNTVSKYFIGYQKGKIIRPLCIKYFKYGKSSMSFFIKDDEEGEKQDQIWDEIKNKLKVEFHSEPVYEYEYLKTKVKE